MITVRMICKAINELWVSKGSVCPSQRTRQKIRERGYFNLKKRHIDNARVGPKVEEEWSYFTKKVASVRDGWHATIDNETSVSFIRVEPVEYDGVRNVTEVNLKYIEEEKAVQIKLKYHQREIYLESFPDLERQLEKLNISEKANFIFNFLDESAICPGFSCADLQDNTPLSNLYQIHNIKNVHDNTTYKKIFSSRCLLLKTEGAHCSECAKAKYLIERIKKRRESMDDVKLGNSHIKVTGVLVDFCFVGTTSSRACRWHPK